ncbi:hypothetical protein AKJ57_03425 [candidate division MSBL1 archaeon SCGC-AAA259A05]|uniref:Uncharacterized protein n=1 Tax=candidate division MSBL1 archaeon SCGC-AAA259A05 TaxID=1698259 RepID=A0A133U9J9_9EURY|nr:hypothetical protein AKJ57_03425 [candidate division MSBL1 archaeon SCGC-AAA259A05]
MTGILDVGIIAIAHFENPAQGEAFGFLSRILREGERCLIPLTTFLGAYHVMTEYLGVRRTQAERALRKTLETRSRNFYGDVAREYVLDALSCASDYKIESWDGYLISLAQKFEAPVIYTVDEEIDSEIETVEAVNPIRPEVYSEYKEWLRERLEKS